MLEVRSRRSKRAASKNASLKVNLLLEDEFYKTKDKKLDKLICSFKLRWVVVCEQNLLSRKKF